MADVGGVAVDYLRAYVERIEQLEEKKKALTDDIKEVFSSAKGTGFDVKAMRAILKFRKMDKAEYQEQQYMIDLYKHALGMLDFDGTELGQSAEDVQPAVQPEVDTFDDGANKAA